MCVVSNVMGQGVSIFPPYQPNHSYDIADLKRRVTELEEMMKKAMELDKFLQQPDCENAIKKAKLRELARQYGIEIKFPDE